MTKVNSKVLDHGFLPKFTTTLLVTYLDHPINNQIKKYFKLS